ncbi:uncharacterized protein LOC144040722 [Vanacampus margaritifer]
MHRDDGPCYQLDGELEGPEPTHSNLKHRIPPVSRGSDGSKCTKGCLGSRSYKRTWTKGLRTEAIGRCIAGGPVVGSRSSQMEFAEKQARQMHLTCPCRKAPESLESKPQRRQWQSQVLCALVFIVEEESEQLFRF